MEIYGSTQRWVGASTHVELPKTPRKFKPKTRVTGLDWAKHSQPGRPAEYVVEVQEEPVDLTCKKTGCENLREIDVLCKEHYRVCAVEGCTKTAVNSPKCGMHRVREYREKKRREKAND